MYFATNSRTHGSRSSRSMPSLSSLPRRTRLGADWEILRDQFAGQTGAPAAGNVQAVVQQAMSQQALYTTEDCSGASSGQSKVSLITGVGGSMAAKWATTAIAAGSTGPLAPLVLIGAGVLQVFSAIFGHHAAKVKQEQQIICAVVQAVNDSISVIDQAFQQGQINAQGAAGSFDQLFSDLQKNVQPILKQDKDHCNAACFILAEARGVIAKKKDQYLRVPPPNAPPGSYVQTCRNMVVNGDVMTAECQGINNGGWSQTSISNLSTCAAIDNIGGQLTCTVQKPAPILSVSEPTQATNVQTSNPADLVNSLTQSTGIPSWAIWGIGALLLMRVIE